MIELKELANTCWQHLSSTQIDPGFGPGNQAKDIIYNYLKIARSEPNDRTKLLVECLRSFIYETTHLSPENDDGSHDCKISKETIESARNCLKVYEEQK